MNTVTATQGRRSLAPNFLLSNASMLCIILGAWLVVYIPGLFHPSLLDDADSVHAEASREMLLNHDWVTLYVDGIRYLAKAPLMYWMVAVSYKLFGISEWQTRLPLVLSVLLLAWCVYVFGRKFFGKEAGFYAALITITSPGFYVFTRFLIPEVLVAIFLTLGLYFFLLASEQPEPSRLALLGDCRNRCPQRSDQKPDRPGFSRGNHVGVPVSHRWPEENLEAPSSVEHSRLSCRRRSLARSRSNQEPRPAHRPGKRFSLVLFRQRTIHALPQ